jgi:hypothetical protein
VLSPDFAVLAAVLPLAGFASYLRDTLRGRTRPNRVSWSLWATAPLIAFAAELAQRTSLKVALLTFALGAGPALILAASFACPRAYWAPTRLDLACGTALPEPVTVAEPEPGPLADRDAQPDRNATAHAVPDPHPVSQ